MIIDILRTTLFSSPIKNILSILFVALFLFPACQSKKPKKDLAVIKAMEEKKNEAIAKIEKDLSSIVVAVNGIGITKRELLTKTNETVPQMNPHGRNISKKRIKEIEVLTLHKMVKEELLFQAAEKEGFSLDSGWVEKKIEDIRKSFPNTPLEDLLAKRSKDLDWLSRELRKPDLVAKYKKEKNSEYSKKAKALVTKDYVKKYYDENRKQFLDPKIVRMQQIYIKVKPNAMQQDWEKRLERAVWIIERAKSGDKFVSLAKEFSDDPNAETAGDTGKVLLARLDPKVRLTVKKMKEGEVGGPVQTLYGYYVVKLIESPEQKLNSYEKVVKDLSEKLKRKKKSGMYREWMIGFKLKAKKIISDSDYKTKEN